MLKTNHASQANQNLHESFARILKSINRRLKRNALPLGLSALAAVSMAQSGCSSSFRNLANEMNNNILVEYRDAVWSRRAYNLRYGNCDRPFSNHYRDGFCAGYNDVCNGGDGYVPALPPPEYRGLEYQSAEGAKCVNTWFEGYPSGVAAAKQDKTGDYKDMFISKMINSAVTQDKAKHQLPGDVPIIKPRVGSDASTGTSHEAPPVPEVTQAYGAPPAFNQPAELSLTGPATSNDQAYANAVSVMESLAPSASTFEEVRPALPPIVKAPSVRNEAPSQITSARPSEASPQPLPMPRQANASVLTNQYIR
ncbi:hypothetical protein N9L06_07240 [Mariniblastus sp.]|nr:hypothetical protein [Mariniblastus sp.]